jgi:hypothetical protein
MTLFDGLVIAGIMVALGLFWLGKGSSKKDRPGPHNNWRANKSTSATSSWTESGEGFNGSCGGGSSGGSN